MQTAPPRSPDGTSHSIPLFIEGIAPYTTSGSQIVAYFQPNETGLDGQATSDFVVLRVGEVHVSIDANDGWIELNLMDRDGDLIPDYVDGYQWSHDPAFAQSENNHLVPLHFTMFSGLDLPNAQVRFTYSANDPLLGTERYELPGATAAGFTVTDDGHLRIWNLPGPFTRVGQSPHLHQEGNFLASGQAYTLDQLGTPIDGVYTLWVEAVRPSQMKHDLTIEIAIDPHGTGEFVHTREVKVTAVGTRDGWHNQALNRAIIDPARWNPTLGFVDQQQIVVNAYDYYRRTFLKDSQKLLWAGLGRMAGGSVYTGLQEIRRRIDNLKNPDPDNPNFGLYLLYTTAEVKFLEIQKRIFADLAWQHEAYLTGGVKTLELLHEYQGENTFEEANLNIWRNLHLGNIADANLALVFREQRIIAQPVWDEIGTLVGVPIGWSSRSPLPNGLSFTEFSGSSFESIAVFENRWNWIIFDMWPKWLQFSDQQRRNMANAPLGSQIGDP